jgi:hypothetical protein
MPPCPQPERWQIHYAGVRVGPIQQRSGAPPSCNQWEFHCGFYPGSDPGEQRYGTAATFDEARIAFEAAWRDYLPSRTEADFEEWREDAAWHAAKYARWDRNGERRI